MPYLPLRTGLKCNFLQTALNCKVFSCGKGNRKAMNRNWSNQKANPALKTKAGNK